MTGMLEYLATKLRDPLRDEATALDAVLERSRARSRDDASLRDAALLDAGSVRHGILVGRATTSEGEDLDVRLSPGEENVNWVVQGSTGAGKTTFVTSILLQELGLRRAFGLIDCKGDLFYSAIAGIAASSRLLEPERRDELRNRLLVVNPFSDTLVPLNVCRPLRGISPEAQAYEVTLALARLFDAGLGIQMENVLRHLVLLLIDSDLTLAEAPRLLEDELLRGMLASRSKNQAVKDFFLGTYPVIPQISKDALLSRLQGLLLSENVRLMLGADECIDLTQILERGDPMLVFLGKGPSVPEEQVEILGGLFFQMLLQATYARGSGARRPYLLAVDEFFKLLDAPGLARRFETALTTARSFGLSLVLVNHNLAQLPAALREIILGNTDLVALFRTSSRNAEFFGDFLPEAASDETRRARLEELQRLPNRELYWYDRRKPYRAIRLRACDVPRPHEIAGVSEGELERIIAAEGWNRGGRAASRTELRSQIEARAERLRELLRPKAPPRPEKPAGDPEKPPKKKGRPKLG